jgi:hypothetical protein
MWLLLVLVVVVDRSLVLARLASTSDTIKGVNTISCPRRKKGELREWRESNTTSPKGNFQKRGNRRQSFSNKQLSALVSKRVKFELAKDSEDRKEHDEGEAYIMSLVRKAIDEQTKSGAQVTASANSEQETHPSTLNSILRRAKNNRG